MSTMEMPDEVMARFEREAIRRGISLTELFATVAQSFPDDPTDPPTRRLPGFVAIGTSSSGLTARDADVMLAEGFGQD
jgi:hypothetical protein